MDEQRREAKEGKSQRKNPRSITRGATENAATASVDYQLEECLLAADDPDLFYDLRQNNGRICDVKYDPFGMSSNDT